ncbi:MAG: ABC transporter ATP-binding protein [Leptospirales bacterium]|nr:ABC transporter ATP-binding protein [Leptospirales bacterium]
MSLVSVRDLKVRFHSRHGLARAVDGVGFQIKTGQTHALVGESGCGKSVTSLALAGLLPRVGVEMEAAELRFRDTNLLELNPFQYREIRGRHIAMIFQEPMTALNPVMRVGNQILEAILLHESPDGQNLKKRVIDLMANTGLAEPDLVFEKYPHQLSGGMRQRIMIAMALALKPALLIADEPTTALDVTVQAQILSLMNQLQTELGTAILLITHDLGVVASTAHTMSVLYAGQVVEAGRVRDVFANPTHPYTEALFAALPARAREGELKPIPGSVPSATEYSRLSPCRFFERCQYKNDTCFRKPLASGHTSWCGRQSGTGESAA